VIEEAESDGPGRKVRLGLVDAVSSSPGVVVPWEGLCELFREKGVLRCVELFLCVPLRPSSQFAR
jgi:selenocysteine lyase/cysteine desulfurase